MKTGTKSYSQNWMNGEIMKDWLQRFDSPVRLRSRTGGMGDQLLVESRCRPDLVVWHR